MTPTDFPEQPVPPVFINEHGDLSVFRSVSDATAWIEAIDVQNEEYCGYDSLGRSLNLSTDGFSVRISLAERVPTHVESLLAILHSFLHALSDPVAEDSSYQLPELVSHFTRYTQQPPRSLWQAVTSLFHTRS